MFAICIIVEHYIRLVFLFFFFIFFFILLGYFSIYFIRYFINLFIVIIKHIYSWWFSRVFRKDFIKDLIFYRIFPHNFYQTYTQLNLNYMYYPTFYLDNKEYLMYAHYTAEFFDLLRELDAMEDSLQVKTVRDLVDTKINKFKMSNLNIIFRYIYYYSNAFFLYSCFVEKDHDIYSHFENIEKKNALFDEFYVKNKFEVKWRSFIWEDVMNYHLNTIFYESYKYDEQELFSYFPQELSPVGYLESLDSISLKEFLKTDYCILLKDEKDLKTYVGEFFSFRYFNKFLNNYRESLTTYYNYHNKKSLSTGYISFTDTINMNFHFSNFLFFSHIYLQTWEDDEHEDTLRYMYNLDIFPDSFYLFIIAFFYFFYFYFLYWFFFYQFFFFFFFLFLQGLFFIFYIALFIIFIIY